MSSLTIEEVLEKTKVSSNSLEETECTDDHFLQLHHFCDPWKVIGYHLKFTADQLNAIDGDNPTVEEKRLAVFKEWKQTLAFRATFLVLVQALVNAKRAQNAVYVKLCEWFKENVMTRTGGKRDSTFFIQ
jgi:hypothetical protein